jgi:DNA (cytosine-5)-methyltransferase 1
MLTPQLLLPLHDELIVDLFAGGGGASTGIEIAAGRHVDIAINHDREAIALHCLNHPQTEHLCSDVFEVRPLAATKGRPVGLLWASPDCKHFSKAKGKKPVDQKIRSLAWVVVRWAQEVKPRIIMLENVEEFEGWGPLDDNNLPCSQRKGQTFQLFVRRLRKLGYAVEWKVLSACDYGAPTIRKRLFLIARRDRQPIVWPTPTHVEPSLAKQTGLKPFNTAAQCIDWSVLAPSIFTRNRPLADATCRRVAKGIIKYTINCAEPFIVPVAHFNGSTRVHRGDQPLRTITSHPVGGSFALAVPITAAFIAKHYTGVVGSDCDSPLGTVTSIDHHSVVTAHLSHYNADKRPCDVRASDLRHPIKTQTTENRHAIVICKTGPVTSPAANAVHPNRCVSEFLLRYGGSDASSHAVAIVDIGLRMLTPRELYRAQGFSDSYVIDRQPNGKPLTKKAQVRMCGNSVCPPVACALVQANFVAMAQLAAA